MQTTMRLTMTVTYDTHGTKKDKLAEMLSYISHHAETEGMLTDDTKAEVTELRTNIEEIIEYNNSGW